MEFFLLSGVGGFEKVILFYVLSCGLEKIALLFNMSDYILLREPKLRFKVLNIPPLAYCMNGVSR